MMLNINAIFYRDQTISATLVPPFHGTGPGIVITEGAEGLGF